MNLLQQKKEKYFSKILLLPYLPKKTVFIADLLIVSAIFIISVFLCDNLAGKAVSPKPFVIKLILFVTLSGFFFFMFSTYRGVLRYSSFRDAPRIFFSLFCSNAILLAILLSAYPDRTLSIITIFINLTLGFSSIIVFRMMVRLFFDYVKNIYTNKKPKRLLIYGTNPVQISLAKMIRDNEFLPYSIAGFISPETSVSKQKIINYSVYNKNDFFSNATFFQHIDALLIVSEELNIAEKQLLVDKCAQYKIELLSSPSSLNDWKQGEKKKRKIDKLRIEDLLGRLPIHIDTDFIECNLKGKTVLITGAAGSIGSEIVRQLCGFNVKMLLLCDMAESPLHELSLELNDYFPDVQTQLLIADIRNYDRMKMIFEQYTPQFVYHAAAYKHVPLMEMQPSEAIMVNVQGTKNIADLSVLYKSECFVMVSSDKAVNPSNVMGASKRIAEIYVQYLSRSPAKNDDEVFTRFITTRFGNVLGSNGSVIPRFTKQIENGGPITVTHRDIIRYFMTIPEACNLVLEASHLGKGGEIFVFDMGEPVKIRDMAESMIRLSGFVPYKDIHIIYTGLRPGEKLFEELLYHKENKLPTSHEKIMINKNGDYQYEEAMPDLLRLIEIAKQNDDPMNIVRLMKKIVPEFISKNSPYCILDIENTSSKAI